jgi:DNA-binding MarR family transcriptional regulator
MARGSDRDDQRAALPADGSETRDARSGSVSTQVQALAETRSRSRDAAERSGPIGRPLPSGSRREAFLYNRQTYTLRGSQSRVLETLATFRVVLERDLRKDVYRGLGARVGRELKSLVRQGLVATRDLAADRAGHHLRVATLTREGRALLEHHRGPARFSEEQDRPVFNGWGKAGELVHDASLYRMYLVEEARILEEGGTIRRVVLDDELKQTLYRELNQLKLASADERRATLAELAQAENLPVVDGHVQFPDVRIEYDTASGQRSKVDLELTTDHYHASHLATKARAGFSLYSASGHSARGVASLGGGRGGASFDPHFLSGLLSL